MKGPRVGDVYGVLLADAVDGKPVREVVERDDGFVMAFDGRYLLAPISTWDDPNERRAMKLVRGRALDVGCGGGQVCLHLPNRGLDVVGIDASPGAVQVCKRRGVRDARIQALDTVDASLGHFDTIVMLGQGFGMFGSKTRARRLLQRFPQITRPAGRIIAETFDPHGLDDPVQRNYCEANRRRGRMPGQLRVRVRYRNLATP